MYMCKCFYVYVNVYLYIFINLYIKGDICIDKLKNQWQLIHKIHVVVTYGYWNIDDVYILICVFKDICV